jgi:hypothetical protein
MLDNSRNVAIEVYSFFNFARRLFFIAFPFPFLFYTVTRATG